MNNVKRCKFFLYLYTLGKERFVKLNTFSIKLFFSEICIVIFLHMVSFALFEIKQRKNKFGGIFTILFSLGSIILSVFVFWTN